MTTSYQVTEWNTGDTITKDKMNKIEKGIETNSKEFGNYATRIEPSDYIPNSAKGVSVATLENGKIPMSQIPDSDTGQTISGYVKNVTSDGNATLTITTDSSPHNITINNVEHSTNSDIAIKAEQDSEGNVIKDSYLKTNGNTFLQGTLYNHKGGRITLKTGSENTDNGLGIIIDSSQQYILLYNWVGKKAYLRCYGGGRKGPLQTDYQPDGTNDNELATCKYVNDKATGMDIALMSTLNQCWKKDASGIIHQFVELEATTEEIDIQLPVSFPEKCLFVGVEILNPQKDSSVSEIKFETIEKTLDSVKLLKIGTGTPTISVMAVGI